MSDAQRVLDRIEKLLALGASDNKHEAEAAMAAAQRLMLRYNIEEGAARAARGYVSKCVGEGMRRRDLFCRVVASILQAFFFVEVLWVTQWRLGVGHVTCLEVVGTPTNVAVAEYVTTLLYRSAAHAANVALAAKTIPKGTRSRNAFRVGVAFGFMKKLDAERERSTAAGLVWVGDPGLQAHVRGLGAVADKSRSTLPRDLEALGEGIVVGEALTLHRAIESEASDRAPAQLGRGAR